MNRRNFVRLGMRFTGGFAALPLLQACAGGGQGVNAGNNFKLTARLANRASFEAVAQVHRLMTARDAQSDVRRLSKSAHLRPMRVHAHTLAGLRPAKEMHARSEGIFDIAVGALRGRGGHVPALALPWRGVAGSSDEIEIAPDGEVSVARPLHLDLGGVAKGHAVDCAVAG